MSDTAAHPTAAYPIAAITILGGYFAMNRQEARLSKVLLGVVAIFFPPIVAMERYGVMSEQFAVSLLLSLGSEFVGFLHSMYLFSQPTEDDNRE